MDLEEEIAWKIRNDCAMYIREGRNIASVIMPLVKRAQAEALREAAELLSEKFQDIPAWTEAYREGVRTDEWMLGGVRMTMSAIQVLRDRADQFEKEAGA